MCKIRSPLHKLPHSDTHTSEDNLDHTCHPGISELHIWNRTGTHCKDTSRLYCRNSHWTRNRSYPNIHHPIILQDTFVDSVRQWNLRHICICRWIYRIHSHWSIQDIAWHNLDPRMSHRSGQHRPLQSTRRYNHKPHPQVDTCHCFGMGMFHCNQAQLSSGGIV